MKHKLTPQFIAKAPLPKPDAKVENTPSRGTDKTDKSPDRVLYWDAELSGFGLCVTKNGARSFVLQYRSAGRSRRMHLGEATAHSLKSARDQARALLGQVAAGRVLRKPVDPLQQRRNDEAAEAARQGSGTLEAVAEEFFRRDGSQLRSAARSRATLQRLVYGHFRSRPIGSIRKSEIVRLLDNIDETSGPTMADAVLAILSRVMRWHQARDDEFRTPIVPGLRRGSSRKRDRVLTDDELRAVWLAAEADGGPVGSFVQFLLLTAARRNEVARMRRGELNGSVWTVPAARFKTGIDHEVPLSGAAQAVLAGVPRIGTGEHVFSFNGVRPMSGFAHLKARFDRACGVTDWTFHDLRRTSRSLMSRAGVQFDIAERCLGHTMGTIRSTYDRHEYSREKLAAFEALASLVDRIVRPVADNVVQLAG